jgi:hypothetical protein
MEPRGYVLSWPPVAGEAENDGISRVCITGSGHVYLMPAKAFAIIRHRPVMSMNARTTDFPGKTKKGLQRLPREVE